MRNFYRKLQSSNKDNIPPSPPKNLAEGVNKAEGVNNVEAIALRILSEHQAISIANLVTLVAAEAMVDEQRQGGWVSDIGFWGPSYYHDVAYETVRAMIGHSLALQFEGTCIAVPIA